MDIKLHCYKTVSFTSVCLFLVVNLASSYCQSSLPSPSQTALLLHLGISEHGAATSAWREAIRDRHEENELAQILAGTKKFSEEESQWAELITNKIARWQGMIDSLRIPFENVTPPDTVRMLLGNRGGGDAFTYAPMTICFDLSELQQYYGAAANNDNRSRIDRFFAHEFTHILHKAWRKQRGVEFKSPFEFALWECLTEGLGNYRSLSNKWLRADWTLTPHAQDVLQRLQPIFVERLAALEHATEAEAAKLMEGLSSGPFEKKWGALTTALWLAQEARGDDRHLRKWVEAGPWGVLVLAQKHLPEALKAKMPKSG